MEKNTSVREPMVNICITTFNRISYTKQCIDSILETTSDAIPFMITVIDNGSDDGTPEYLRELRADGKIDNMILLKENIGIAKAQNICWKLFEDVPYTAKIDNDVVFKKKGWLDAIINTFENTNKIGALGYQCKEDGANYPIVKDNGTEYRVKNGNIGGACFFVPKHIKDELGFWNSDCQKSYGEEDALLGERIKCAGYRNAYMVDRDTMIHLPDRDEDKNYRKFKDQERTDNLRGNFWPLINGYRNGTIPLKVDTNILNEVEYELI